MAKFEFAQEVQSQAHLRQSGRCAHCGVSLVWGHDQAMPVFPVDNTAGAIGDWKKGVDNCVVLCQGCTMWTGVEDPASSTSLTDPDEYNFSHGVKNNGSHREWVVRMMGR